MILEENGGRGVIWFDTTNSHGNSATHPIQNMYHQSPRLRRGVDWQPFASVFHG